MKDKESVAYKALGRNDRDTASQKGSKIPSVVLHEIESIVRMGYSSLPERLKIEQLKEHYEPDTENIISIDVLSVPSFPEYNGSLKFSNIVVLEVGEFSEATRDEIMREAFNARTKITKHRQACPDTTYILITHKEQKGFRMKFLSGQFGHRRPQNEEGSEYWMVFNAKQSGPAIRKKIFEILGNWFDKRSAGVKNAAEKKGFTLFGALEICYKFVSALSRALQKLAAGIKILSKTEKNEIKKSCTMMHDAKIKGVKFSRRNGLWIEDAELTDSKRVWDKILRAADAQGIWDLERITRQEFDKLCNAVPDSGMK